MSRVLIGDRAAPGTIAWQRALGELGLPPARVLSWAALLDDADELARALDGATHVRVDTPGRDAALDARLVALGDGDGRVLERGRIAARSAWYRGLVRAMQRLDACAGGAVRSHEAEHVALAFDKRRCHAVLHAHGVAVPEALPAVHDWAELKQAMRERGWTRVFVKPCHGSSGSGVVALRWTEQRTVAWAGLELERRGRELALFNVRPAVRFHDEATIGAVVDALAPDGIHVERWLPKASWPGAGAFDLRVLTIAGRPSHVVARVARGPITNLQLGARRIHGAPLRERLAPAWPRLRDELGRAAAAFAGAAHVAFDVLVTAGLARHAVIEANAFGDLLHGVVDEHGLGTHAAQLAQLGLGVRFAEASLA